MIYACLQIGMFFAISPKEDSNVVRPANVRFLDYEIALGLVMPRAIYEPSAIADPNLHEFVAGAVIVNDYSARDVQIPQTPFYKGQSICTFDPVGPTLGLLDAESIGLLKQLELRLTVNGEARPCDLTFPNKCPRNMCSMLQFAMLLPFEIEIVRTLQTSFASA